MNTSVVTVKNLTKLFSIYHKPHEALLDLLPYFSSKIQKHTALDNVSFEVYKGEFVGIIGQNGSGKSTLLKILCGVLHQTAGEIKINGKILSLLELGTGFNPDLTGRENLFVSAALMGFDTKLITESLSDIEAFADIEEYFDAPVKTYSSGMYVRLAMAMFLHLEPEIFIIDEALSVGDIFFQQKCFAKIEEMRQRGVTFILVSHDLGLIAKVCDRVAYLEYGKLLYIGDRTVACQKYYNSHDLTKTTSKKNIEVPSSADALNKQNENKATQIINVNVVDKKYQPTLTVDMMESLLFIISIDSYHTLDNSVIAIVLRNNQNTIVSSIIHDLKIVEGENEVIITVPFTIEAGEYVFDISLGSRNFLSNINTASTISEIKNCGIISVVFDYNANKAPFFGQCYLNSQLIRQTSDNELC